MTTDSTMPELKQILGAMVFATKHPLPAAEMCRVLHEVAKTQGGYAAAFAAVREADVVETLKQLSADVAKTGTGFHLAEAAGGYKLQSDDKCAPWARTLLNADKAHRLSRPSLETLAIIAYRQPITRVEIEAVRGVNVDHAIAALMELELVRMVGRSNVPGRPMLFGTTKKFLEHFGLQSLEALPGVEELARTEKNRVATRPTQTDTVTAPDTSEAEAGKAPSESVSEEAQTPNEEEREELTDESIDEPEEDEDEEDEDEATEDTP
jgi:segregation and condensation protein B